MELMEPDEFRQHLKKKMREHVGTGEHKEAHRRYDVLWEWRRENGDC